MTIQYTLPTSYPSEVVAHGCHIDLGYQWLELGTQYTFGFVFGDCHGKGRRVFIPNSMSPAVCN